MTGSDLSLYEAMRSDDQRQVNAAAQELTNRVEAIALRFVLRNSGTQADAEDIVQETVVDVWRQMRSGAYQPQPDSRLNAYLKQIVKNKWLKKLGHPATSTIELKKDMLEGVPNEQDLVDRLEEALDQLGTECQKLIRTYYYEGFQLKEIADKLDLSLGTIKMQKYRCLLRLAALLGIK